jgi:hypothetical protein
MRILRRFNPGGAPVPEAPVLSGSVTNYDDLSYTWTAPANATEYKFQFSQNSDFTGAGTATTTSTSRSYPDRSPGGYYARVMACNERGCSSWSNVVYLESTSNTSPTITLTGDNPYSFNEGGTYTEPGYSASDAEDGDITANVTSTNNINPNVPGTYYVDYQVSDIDGNTAKARREVRVLGVQKPPAAPTITGELIDETTVGFDWNVPAGTDYFEYRDAVNGADITLEASEQKSSSTTSHNYSNLTAGTQICAQIRGCNEVGCSAWSNIACVTVPEQETNPPNVPTLSGQVLNLDELHYSWNAPTGATNYNILVSTSSDFSGATPINTSVNSYSQIDKPYGTYYAKVQACNDYGCSDWSNIVVLEIVAAIPAVPVLDGNITASNQYHWFWNDVEGEHYYRFQYDEQSDFSSPVTVQTSSIEQLLDLGPGTYYGRVQACRDDVGCSGFSNVVVLTVAEAPLEAPVLSGSHNMPKEATITYTWTDPNTTEKNYYIQVSRNNTFTDIVVSQSQTFFKFTTGALLKNKYYYARVRAENDTETGPWSDVLLIYLPDNEPTYIKPVRAYVEGLKEYEADGIYFTNMRTICVEFDHEIKLADGNTSSDNPFPLGYKSWGIGPIHAGRANLKISNYGFYEGKGTFNKLFVYGASVSGKILKLQIPATFHHTFTGSIYLGGGNHSVVTYKGNSSVKIDKSYDVNIEKPPQETSSNDLRIIGCDMKWNGSRVELFVACSAMFLVDNEYGNNMVKDAAQGYFRLFNDNRSVFKCTGITKNSISDSDYGTVLYIWFDNLKEPEWAYDHTLYFNTNNPEGNPLTIGNHFYGEILRQTSNVGGLYPINYLF